jgi:hypothetical protein
MIRTLFLLLCFSIARPALAERIVVGAIEFAGTPLPERSRDNLKSNFKGGLAASGLDVVPSADVDRARHSAAGLPGCNTAACLKRVGELVTASHSVLVKIEMQGTSNYIFTLKLFDNAAGQLMSEIEDRCEMCTLSEANEKLSSCAAALRGKISPPSTATPEVTPTPVVLTPPPPIVDQPRRAYRAGAIATLAIGVPAIVAGAVLWSFDGHQAQMKTINNLGETNQYSTAAIGIPLVAAGGALVVTSVILWALDARQRHRPRVILTPAVDKSSLSAALSARF